MKAMITGQYVMGDSVIHRLDPRTKLLACLAIIIAASLPQNTMPVLLLNILFIIIIIQLSKLGIFNMLRGLKSLRVLFLLTFICQVFFTSGEPLGQWGKVLISREGIELAVTTFLRLVLLYLGASLLTMTTSSLKLSAGLESLLSPLSYLRFPVAQFAMIINISLRFIPTILEELEIITRAQRSRGARFDSGPLAQRLKNTLVVLIPLLAASIQRANDLALAMESRCYSATNTNYSRVANLRLSWKDAAAMALLVLFLLLPALFLGTKL